MVAILNFICLYQEIEYQKLFENNNEIYEGDVTAFKG
jgi:hypothetical protein